MAIIEILDGENAGRSVELGPGRHLIGRNADSAIRLAVSAVSGKHLELEVAADGAVRFKDLGSTNGTWSGGLKVTEGEWFVGSELKVGNIRLRLSDPNAISLEDDEPAPVAAASDNDDDAIHRRAVEAAMSGRGGALKFVLLLVVVAGLGGGAYWYFNRDTGQEGASGESRGGGPSTASASLDLIDDLGDFSTDNAASWALESGLSIRDGALRNEANHSNPRVASLGQRFPLFGTSLRIEAQVEGSRVRPLVSFGRDDDERALAAWSGSHLSGGSVELRLPDQAEWFSISLVLEGRGTVRGLSVEEGEADPVTIGNAESWKLQTEGANLLLMQADGRVALAVAGTDGAWQPTSGGLDFRASTDSGWLGFTAGPAVLEQGALLILAEGGPVGAAQGVIVEDSPGLLISGETRVYLPFDQNRRVVVRGGEVQIEGLRAIDLRWNLTEVFRLASETRLEMDRAAREKDHATLLDATARLLRDYPLQDRDVDLAISLRSDAILQGQQELDDLRVALAEAIFFESIEDIRAVKTRADQLAASLPNTVVAQQAQEISLGLGVTAEVVAQQAKAERDRYRARLVQALEPVYPIIAAWVEDRS